MSKLIRFTALAALLVSSAAIADGGDKKYTLADIKTLVGQKSYAEAVAHLDDIAPADRNADWLEVAADAAGGYVKSLSNDDLGTKVVTIEDVEQRFPQVMSAPKYVKVRNDVGMKAYTECFKVDYATDVCLQHALKFVEGDAGNTALALKMGKLVRLNANHHVAVPFFVAAVAGKTDAAACKDEDLALAVVSGLALPSDEDNAKSARDLASGPCWSKLKKPVLAEFKDGGDYYWANTCDFLKAKKALSAAQAKLCK